MVGWIILGIFVALLLLLLFTPVGVDVGYEDGEFHLSAKVSKLLIQLLPRKPGAEKKPKKEKKPKEKKKKEEPKEEPKEDKPKKQHGLPFDRDEILELVRTVLHGIGKFGRAWHVDRFVLHYTAAGPDPYDTAMTYGYVNAALSSLAPLCRERFRVKDCSVWTDVDFLADWMSLDLGVAMTITLWRIFGVINAILFGALKILIRSKRRRKKEAKALKKAGGVEGADLAETENENTENIQAEERMAANG